MKKIIAFIILFMLLFTTIPVFIQETVKAADTDFYVSGNGNDAFNGEHPDWIGGANGPWLTIDKVNTEMNGGNISQSDDVYFNRTYTYSDDGLEPRLGGTSDDWMIIGAYGTGADPILSGEDASGNGINSLVTDIGYVKFQDFDVKGQSNIGIRWRADGFHNMTFFNIDISNTGGGGIIISGIDHYRIENCTIRNSVDAAISIYGSPSAADTRNRNGIMLNTSAGPCTSGTADVINYHQVGGGVGIDIGDSHYAYNCTANNTAGEDGWDVTSGSNIYLKDCQSFANSKRGYGAGHDVRKVFVDGFYMHNETGSAKGGFTMPSFHNFTMRFSTIENCEAAGVDDHLFIASNEGTDESWDSGDLILYNNNFIYEDNSGQVAIHTGSTWGPISKATFKNNIFQSEHAAAPTWFFSILGSHAGNALDDSDCNFTNNLWWRTGGTMNDDHWRDGDGNYNWGEWTAKDRVYGSIRADANFSDIHNGNYTLNSTSPCIDAGDWLTYTVGSGSGQTITVDEAGYFFGGLANITHYNVPGDNIFIGDDTDLEIIGVNYTNNKIQVNRSIDWDDGDSVSLSSYQGSKIDIGANEFVAATPWSNSAPVNSNPDPQDGNTSVSLTPPLRITVSDADTNQSMNISWYYNDSGVWYNFGNNNSVSDGTYYQTFSNATAHSTYYEWSVNTSDNSTTPAWDNDSYSFTTLAPTIGWKKYYGNDTGTNFTINTYEVIQVYINGTVSNVTIYMTHNSGINYSASRTVNLTYNSTLNGYNYTGVINNSNSTTDLSTQNSSLFVSPADDRYFLALWNETDFLWNFWICGFASVDKYIHQYDVLVSKIRSSRDWTI